MLSVSGLYKVFNVLGSASLSEISSSAGSMNLTIIGLSIMKDVVEKEKRMQNFGQ